MPASPPRPPASRSCWNAARPMRRSVTPVSWSCHDGASPRPRTRRGSHQRVDHRRDRGGTDHQPLSAPDRQHPPRGKRVGPRTGPRDAGRRHRLGAPGHPRSRQARVHHTRRPDLGDARAGHPHRTAGR
ncbi:hypothetical protein G6F40_015843 [Rhizopus arrhizus]|nr:hypothetical protein G6F40_015843 [Rhizopus arrhizus]